MKYEHHVTVVATINDDGQVEYTLDGDQDAGQLVYNVDANKWVSLANDPSAIEADNIVIDDITRRLEIKK